MRAFPDFSPVPGRGIHPQLKHDNGVEAFLYCQLEGAVGDETVTLARQQSTDIFFLVR